jgi:hypothetical protein
MARGYTLVIYSLERMATEYIYLLHWAILLGLSAKKACRLSVSCAKARVYRIKSHRRSECSDCFRLWSS